MTLAIHGGKPVRESYLAYGQQWLDESDMQAVMDVLRSPFITQGPAIAAFEQKVAAYTGAKYAIAFANGTAALHGACAAADIEQGDEVITSPITFAASANCVLYCGGTPVFADIDPVTYNICPEKIEQAITPNTKAIIAVDFTGQPADMERIHAIAKKHNLIVIEDAAHSLGASYKGNKVGTQADMTMFSFHPVKHVTTGEGGMIVTNSEALANKLRLFRSHGIEKNTEQLASHGAWYYEMTSLGYNYRMTDIQAALGISQMEKLDRFVNRRCEIVDEYNLAFSKLEGVQIPKQLPNTFSSWHLYILSLDLSQFKVNRRGIFDALRAENIGVHVHYIPIYWQPYYLEHGYSKGLCPIAENWYASVFTLPLFPKMTTKDVKTVIEGIKKVLNYYRR